MVSNFHWRFSFSTKGFSVAKETCVEFWLVENRNRSVFLNRGIEPDEFCKSQGSAYRGACKHCAPTCTETSVFVYYNWFFFGPGWFFLCGLFSFLWFPLYSLVVFWTLWLFFPGCVFLWLLLLLWLCFLTIFRLAENRNRSIFLNRSIEPGEFCKSQCNAYRGACKHCAPTSMGSVVFVPSPQNNLPDKCSNLNCECFVFLVFACSSSRLPSQTNDAIWIVSVLLRYREFGCAAIAEADVQ